MSILWIVPKWPLPAHDGARHATVSLVTNLVAQGRVIDLLALAGHDETIDLSLAKSELGVRDVMVIRRSGGEADRLGLLTAALLRPLTPITMRHYCTTRMRRRLGALLRGASEASDMRLVRPESQHRHWRTVVYDGLHPACSSSSCGKFVRLPGIDHIVYRAHNREADIWLRKVSQSAAGVRRFLFGYQARRVRVFENSVVAQSDALAPVSSEDLRAFGRDCRLPKTQVVPIGYDFGVAAPPPAPKPSQLMFIGRLDWPPNREGLKWFLETVWPEVVTRRAGLSLVIAGGGNSAWLSPYLSSPSIEFLGHIPSVEPLYARCVLSLVPVFYGSGTRVKVIEASRFARACLSTALGVEGTGLEDGRGYLRAETTRQWVDQLVTFEHDDAQKIGQHAYGFLKRDFEASAAARRFGRLLDDLA